MDKESQCADKILMVRPARFGYNLQTAKTNAFQNAETSDDESLNDLVKLEFDSFVKKLTEADIQVIVADDTENPIKPDAIFPNNWLTTHSDGVMITYPMFAHNRRSERSEHILLYLSRNFHVHQRYSFEFFEEEGKYLEGTGSMILDRQHRIVYACISARTSPELLDRFALLRNYKLVMFHAHDPSGIPVYHTNVIMAVGETEAVICLECIENENEKNQITESLLNTGKKIVELSWEQVLRFAGNMLQVKNKSGKRYWVMSESVMHSLNEDQKKILTGHSGIVNVGIPTIEKYGGGSARCMMAEIFLEKRKA